jgi:dihydrofolate reductase
MGRIVVSDNVSLDGVVQDPAGDEGFERGGWVGLIKDRPELGKLALEEALGARALLLGRRSYDWFANRWPARSGELADRLNASPSTSCPRHSKTRLGLTRRFWRATS